MTNEPARAITSDDLRMLRQAVDLSFVAKRVAGEWAYSDIVCTWRSDGGDPTLSTDRRYEVPINNPVITNFSGRQDPIAQVGWIVHAKYDWESSVRTMLLHLRPGDQLTPKFVVGNEGASLRDLGFSFDEFVLEVHRKATTAKGKRTYEYRMGSQCISRTDLFRNLMPRSAAEVSGLVP